MCVLKEIAKVLIPRSDLRGLSKERWLYLLQKLQKQLWESGVKGLALVLYCFHLFSQAESVSLTALFDLLL